MAAASAELNSETQAAGLVIKPGQPAAGQSHIRVNTELKTLVV